MQNYLDLNDYELLYMVSENDDDANYILFEKYKPIVVKQAKNYYRYGKNCGLELDDFIQEGFVGLYDAIRYYSDNRNCLFYTYANILIKSKMENLLNRNNTNRCRALNDAISLNSLIDNMDDNCELIDLLEDKNGVLPEQEVIKNNFYQQLSNIIFSLTFEQGNILELKLNGFSNKDISQLLGIKQSTVSSIFRVIRKRIYSLKKSL